MTYINEMISKENLEKFKIVDLWNTYHPFNKVCLDESTEISWVVDQVEQSYLILLKIGKEEWSNEHTFAFSLDKNNFIVTLRKDNLDSQRGANWSLVSAKKNGQDESIGDRALEKLKEALRVYGYRGIWRQLDDYLVEFSF